MKGEQRKAGLVGTFWKSKRSGITYRILSVNGTKCRLRKEGDYGSGKEKFIAELRWGYEEQHD